MISELSQETHAQINELPEATQNYTQLLLEYNEIHNIYSKKAYDHLPFHLNDSLTMADLINNFTENVSRGTFRLYDMGSGSGLPSVIIAQQCPHFQVYAMESRGKKCDFLKQCGEKLNLKNYHVIHGNIYEYFHTSFKRADVVTAKAFAPLEKAIPLAEKLLKKDGLFIMPLGESQRQALTAAEKAKVKVIDERHYYLHRN